MKNIKIFALPSHASEERVSGVDFARIIQPMKYLNGFSDGEVRFDVDTYDPVKEIKTSEAIVWLDVAREYDIIYFNYLNNPWGFAAMGAMARKLEKKIIMDLDDNLWNVQADNPSHATYHKGSQALKDFSAICNEVDWMTTTNSYLKNVIAHNTYKRPEKIKVFPNYIDLSLYKHRAPFKNTLKIQLMHHGSTTHFLDLSNEAFMQGVDRIMKEYPNVSVRFVGAFLPKLKNRWGSRFEVVYGDPDIYKWISGKFPTFMDEADILIVPLEENTYTRCKSDIKYLETSSAKIPGVYQRIRQYHDTIEDGVDGFLAGNANEWYTKIKALLDSPTLRQSMGEKAYEKVKETKQIQDHIFEYAEFMKQVLAT